MSFQMQKSIGLLQEWRRADKRKGARGRDRSESGREERKQDVSGVERVCTSQLILVVSLVAVVFASSGSHDT